MPVCLDTHTNPDGSIGLVLQYPPPADMTACTVGVMLAPSEYGTLQMPSKETLAQFFGAGFITPMSAYLIAYCVGRIVGVFNTD